jgi:Prolyl-tRNA synthetase
MLFLLDKDGKRKFVHQTCYGPGVSRILAALISVHGDNSGLIFPFNVAPIQIVVVPIPGEGVAEYSKNFLRSLNNLASEHFLTMVKILLVQSFTSGSFLVCL